MKDKATILRGKRKGEVVELHQYCNDWATLVDGSVVSLGSIEVDMPTQLHIMGQLTHDMEEGTTRRLGQMFRMYYDYTEFCLTGRFKKLKVDGSKSRDKVRAKTKPKRKLAQGINGGSL